MKGRTDACRRFECDELKAQRAQSQAKLEQAQADPDKMQRAGNRPEEIAQSDATARAQQATSLDAARNGPRRQEIDQAQADYAASSADSTNAEITYKRMEKLVMTDTISRQQFGDARDKRDAAAQRAGVGPPASGAAPGQHAP